MAERGVKNSSMEGSRGSRGDRVRKRRSSSPREEDSRRRRRSRSPRSRPMDHRERERGEEGERHRRSREDSRREQGERVRADRDDHGGRRPDHGPERPSDPSRSGGREKEEGKGEGEGAGGGGGRQDGRGHRQRREREEEEDVTQYQFGGGQAAAGSESGQQEQPTFTLSGKLTAETNTFRGVVINYNEPAEARKPKTRWRLYPFKGEEALPTLYVHRQSAYLIGRDRRVVDVPIDHPSCSKQHAVLQYRLVEHTRVDGRPGRKVKPYIIDLESTNGTYVNNQRIDPARYVELKETDMIKFGFSSREYVLLHENSRGSKEETP